MDTEQMYELVCALGAAKSKQDVEQAVSVQHEEMILRTPAFGSVATGKNENVSALNIFFTWFPDYEVEIHGHAGDGQQLSVWGRVRMTWSEQFLGVSPNGHRVDLPVFMQFTFKENLIASELFFFDLSELCAQSGVSTDAVRERLFGERGANAA